MLTHKTNIIQILTLIILPCNLCHKLIIQLTQKLRQKPTTPWRWCIDTKTCQSNFNNNFIFLAYFGIITLEIKKN
jgi:hypothetical protein